MASVTGGGLGPARELGLGYMGGDFLGPLQSFREPWAGEVESSGHRAQHEGNRFAHSMLNEHRCLKLQQQSAQKSPSTEKQAKYPNPQRHSINHLSVLFLGCRGNTFALRIK